MQKYVCSFFCWNENFKISLWDLLTFNYFYRLILGKAVDEILGSKQKESRDQDESLDQNESTEQDLIIDENESMEQNKFKEQDESSE